MKKTTIFLLLCVSAVLQVAAQKTPEFIYPDKVKINGTVPAMDTKLKTFIREFGAITGRDKKEMECGNYYDNEAVPSRIVYIKGVELETSAENAHMRAIDFSKSPDVFISWPGGRIDKNTTLQDIKKRFPKTARSESNTDGKYFTINTPGESDDSWQIEFSKNGKILRFEYFVPC